MEEDPDAIARLHVNPLDGVTLEAVRELVARAGLDLQAREGAAEILLKLYSCYIEGDADLVEINPRAGVPVCKILDFAKY